MLQGCGLTTRRKNGYPCELMVDVEIQLEDGAEDGEVGEPLLYGRMAGDKLPDVIYL